MSSTSRSQSSSPDILGPPGDADYLISSPIKPFTGRQSWMSPAIVRRQQTPAKRRRVSLSPAKSAHSIRFDDVLLPGSPTMKLDSRQRSLSPEKGQDGNVSPWRIRVTLEATQDEENENDGRIRGSPSPKRRRPSTITMKVPLKDERSPLKDKTPARKRGRPRKSDLAPSGSPWPNKTSPGNTPGTQEGSAGKRKRGRPRKGTPKPKEPGFILAEDEPSPVPRPSPMDLTADAGAAVEDAPLSPINMAVDDGFESDSLGADDLPVANLRPPTPAPARHESLDDITGHKFGRATYDTPTIGATEHHFQDNDENLNSTPSKMPSPTRERQVSSARSNHLSHVVSSPRTYPSPTPTSSLGEEEHQTEEAPVDQYLETINEGLETNIPDSGAVDEHPETDHVDDADEDKQEFDSIMESEGFTMISLDTLPSVKQRGLGSSARISGDDSSKILRDRDNGRIGDRLKRKLPGTIQDLRSDTHSSAKPSPTSMNVSSGSQRLANPPSQLFALKDQSSMKEFSYPELPSAFSPGKPLISSKKITAPSLARIVRVGMALQGPFRAPQNGTPTSSNTSRKRRLETVFSTFSPDTQRELRAAVGFGQELAMRRALREEDPLGPDSQVPADNQGFEESMGVKNNEEAAWSEDDDEPILVQPTGTGQNGVPHHSPAAARDRKSDDGRQPARGRSGRASMTTESAWQLVYDEANRAKAERTEAAWKMVYEAAGRAGLSVDEAWTRAYEIAEHSGLSTEAAWKMVYNEVNRDEVHSTEATWRRVYKAAGSAGPASSPAWQQAREGVTRARENAWQQIRQAASRSEDPNTEAAWQRARDEVRRHAEDPANSDRLIEIESDDNASQDASVQMDDIPDVAQSEHEAVTQDEVEARPQYSDRELMQNHSTASNGRREEEEEEEEDDNDFDDIWQPQSGPRSAAARKNPRTRQAAAEEEDEEDGFDDIWQQEARDNSHLSHSSNERESAPAQEAANSWRRIVNTSNQNPPSSSPGYVAIEHREQTLGPTHIRQLRDQEVDLSALLAEEDTPNRARYFNGTSTPRSILRGRPGAQSSSINGSAIKSSPQKRVRLQPISQSSSPERGVEGSHSSPVTTGHSSQANNSPKDDRDERPAQSDMEEGGPEGEASVEENVAATPEPSRQSLGEPSSWFKRITSLTPRWLKAPPKSHYDSSIDGSEDRQEDEESDLAPEENADPQATIEVPEPDVVSISSQSLSQDPESPENRQEFADNDYRQASYASQSPEVVKEAHMTGNEQGVPAGPETTCSRHPERFPYYDTPGRAQILGDWIWTSDGHHGVPITEMQFAVIDRFVHELSHADVQYGGSGQVEWTEAELHRRLISIIIGEQIREERKIKAARGASVDTWR
ncbi:hypothetical protein N7468_004691 [Penicillium chermesinum]|uniref:AT DNA binding protein n=1 Tax=Penicillium chermesinum TaxID=63820 RepID=A0A9W9PBW8_9EURO|nr:uncharacterized protein N7468_004691 [Penicillium chermesinum]KAJ5240072.1 hypothetical protein N7468_004691 [Penicillium chermesinum]